MSKKSLSKMIEIHPTFLNLRASLTFLGGMIDIGTHMSLIKLSTGKYLVIDTCDVNSTDKEKIDTITNNGELIEAVIGTHPFHTLYFEPFHRWYPNVPYYGTPRHIRRLTSIAWAGDISKPENLRKWEPEGIFMRIPDGADFDPEDQGNHFSCVFVYHSASKTIHIDDTVMNFGHSVGCVLGCLVPRNTMQFWDLKKGLNKTKSAPNDFRQFIEGVINDWDFDNIVAAHTDNKIGNAKAALRETLFKATATLDKLSATAKA
jgi:hypothetical protein